MQANPGVVTQPHPMAWHIPCSLLLGSTPPLPHPGVGDLQQQEFVSKVKVLLFNNSSTPLVFGLQRSTWDSASTVTHVINEFRTCDKTSVYLFPRYRTRRKALLRLTDRNTIILVTGIGCTIPCNSIWMPGTISP